VTLPLDLRLGAALAVIQPRPVLEDPLGQDEGHLNGAEIHSRSEILSGQIQFLSRTGGSVSQKSGISLANRTGSYQGWSSQSASKQDRFV